MGAADLLKALRDAGIGIEAIGGRLRLSGPALAIGRFRPLVAGRRVELVEALKVGSGGTASERLGRIAIRVLGRVSGPHPDGTMSLHVSAARYRLIELAEKRGIEVFRPSADAAILTADAAALVELVEVATRLDDGMRPCVACRHLRGEVCRIAEPGGIVSAARGYRPVEPGKPKRCAGFEGCDVAG